MTVCKPLWERILRADEVNLAYFSQRSECPGVSLFFAERDDAPEFDVALIYDVPVGEEDATLHAIGDAYRVRGRKPCIRLSPCAAQADWPLRLARAGFVEAGERFVYFTVPSSLSLQVNPAVRIERTASLSDADQFSAIQVTGFAISANHQEWDRQLARRHLAEGRHAFYLAWLEGQAIGAGRCIHLPRRMTALAALATLPEARRHGIGTSLLARMVADARAAESRVVFGTAVPSSNAASLYERLGVAFHFTTTTFAERMEPSRHNSAVNGC